MTGSTFCSDVMAEVREWRNAALDFLIDTQYRLKSVLPCFVCWVVICDMHAPKLFLVIILCLPITHAGAQYYQNRYDSTAEQLQEVNSNLRDQNRLLEDIRSQQAHKQFKEDMDEMKQESQERLEGIKALGEMRREANREKMQEYIKQSEIDRRNADLGIKPSNTSTGLEAVSNQQKTTSKGDIFDIVLSQRSQTESKNPNVFNPDKVINAVCIKDFDSYSLKIEKGESLHVTEKDGSLVAQKIKSDGELGVVNFPVLADCVKPVE